MHSETLGPPAASWSLLWAVSTAAAVVARADGRVDDAERQRLASYLDRSEIGGVQSPFARRLFDKCVRELDGDPPSEPRALSSALAGFDATPWAWVILRAAEHVAGADGDVCAAETRAIEAIRTRLDLPPGVPERRPACLLRRYGHAS
jgi:tellurite resistance protein